MDLDLRPSSEVFSKSRITLAQEIKVGSQILTPTQIISKLEPMLLDGRAEKLKNVVGERSLQVVTVLENIYDRGNVSAVMRTAESLGFFKFILIDPPRVRFKAANRITKGAEKWLDVNVENSPTTALQALKAKGYLVAGTDLNATHSLVDVPVDQPIALVIGNEKDGISDEMKKAVDIRIKIPMVGFSQSYNLSVASALCLFELYKKQTSKNLTDEQQTQLYANYLLRCFERPERFFSDSERTDVSAVQAQKK
jgi:tRNA (guanosine-2'-O-)-methyltransferase